MKYELNRVPSKPIVQLNDKCKNSSVGSQGRIWTLLKKCVTPPPISSINFNLYFILRVISFYDLFPTFLSSFLKIKFGLSLENGWFSPGLSEQSGIQWPH